MGFLSCWQEYIRRQLEEEQRHLEMLQEQLLREQAMLLVSRTQPSYYITMSFHLHNLQDMKMTYKSIYISRITAFDLMHFTDFFF